MKPSCIGLRAFICLFVSLSMLVEPTESQACEWLRKMWDRCRGIYTPPVPTACAPVPTTVQYVPETHFRNVTVEVPVTTMRPVVVGCNPCTGAMVTCMRPETVNQTQVKAIPYTTYRLVVSQPTVIAPAITPAVATCAPICGACTGAVATCGVPAATTVTRVITPGFTTAPTFGTAPTLGTAPMVGTAPTFGTAPTVGTVPTMGTAPTVLGGSALDSTPTVTTGPTATTLPSTSNPITLSQQAGGFPAIPTAPTIAPGTTTAPVTSSQGSTGPQTPTPTLRPVTPQTTPHADPRTEPTPQLSPRVVPIPDHDANPKVDPTSTLNPLSPENRTTRFPIKRSANIATVSQKSVRTEPAPPTERGWAPAPTWRPDDSGWQASGERP